MLYDQCIHLSNVHFAITSSMGKILFYFDDSDWHLDNKVNSSTSGLRKNWQTEDLSLSKTSHTVTFNLERKQGKYEPHVKDRS